MMVKLCVFGANVNVLLVHAISVDVCTPDFEIIGTPIRIIKRKEKKRKKNFYRGLWIQYGYSS